MRIEISYRYYIFYSKIVLHCANISRISWRMQCSFIVVLFKYWDIISNEVKNESNVRIDWIDDSLWWTRKSSDIDSKDRKKNKWRANFIARYNGEIAADQMAFSERSKKHIYAIDNQGNAYSPAWYCLNLHGSYVYNKNVVLRMGIDNLMDAQYRPYSSGIAAVGRSFFIGLKGSI